MDVIWIWVSLVCAAGGELWLGTAGLPAPLLAATAFYHVAVVGVKPVLVPACLLGAVLDVTCGRAGPWSLVALLPVLLWALVWRSHGDCRQAALQALPGAALGLLVGAAQVAGERLGGGPACPLLGWPAAAHVLMTVAAGIVALPAVCQAGDAGARRLHLPRYLEIRKLGGRHVH